MRLIWLAALGVALCPGCRKEDAALAGSTAQLDSARDTATSVHWMGRNWIAAQSNATGFMRIWNEPESATLERQTLDKLSQAPWRLLRGESGTNAASALLRPLLDDLVQEESYLEITRSTTQPGALALAIRLNDARAALWETNLAAVLESLTGIQPEASRIGRPGWSLTKHHHPDHIELTRADGWTIVGAGHGTNALLNDFLARIGRGRVPFARLGTNDWLEANLDLPRTSSALLLGWNLPTNLPDLFIAVTGDGQNVRTLGELNFPDKLPLALEPWILPTNLIRGTLGSFTALRGVAPCLTNAKPWLDLRIGPPPNQFFVWSGLGIPLQTFFAAPVPGANKRMSELNTNLLARIEPWLATNDAGHLERAENSDGLAWTTVPFMSPYLHSEGGFVVGGFFPSGVLNHPLPGELLRMINQPNVVYFDWELTGPRIEDWLHLGQLMRIVLHRAQLPGPSASMAFLQVNTNRLTISTTMVSQTGPRQLTLARQSGVGMTAVELHLLADWLESPEFPRGLNTFLGTQVWLRNRRPPPPRAGTGAQ